MYRFLRKESKQPPLIIDRFSILSIVSKVTENNVQTNSWLHILQIHDVLSTNQYGFKPGSSTARAISALLEVNYKKLNQSDIAQTLFLDSSKQGRIYVANENPTFVERQENT